MKPTTRSPHRRSGTTPRPPAMKPGPRDAQRAIFHALCTLILMRRTRQGLPPVPVVPVQPRDPGAVGARCPRCGGFVVIETVPSSGGLTASHCVNCGWQGRYHGLPVDEAGLRRAGARLFDLEQARESLRRVTRSLGKTMAGTRRVPPATGGRARS